MADKSAISRRVRGVLTQCSKPLDLGFKKSDLAFRTGSIRANRIVRECLTSGRLE
jgi:hypothetical protein